MMDRRTALTAFLAASGMQVEAQSPDHSQWVAKVLERMETIKTGMTRATLLTVFTTEGGLSNRSQRTYVSHDCPYFKVDVIFNAPGSGIEGPHDVILKISRPYLQFSILD